MRCVALLGGLLAVLLLAGAAPFPQDHIPEAIRTQVEALAQGRTLEFAGARVSSTSVLPGFYERRKFQPAWTDSRAVADLLRAVRESEADGLSPTDYHLAALEKAQREIDSARQPSPDLRADYDILLSDAMVRLGFHILFGKLDPQRYDPEWNVPRAFSGFDPASAMEKTLASGDLYGEFQRGRPRHPLYEAMKKELARYRAIGAAGGWKPVPAGPTLRLGMDDPRVAPIRHHLALTGDLAQEADTGSTVFDPALEKAVRLFQGRMGLTQDGTVGRGTIDALNLPADRLVDQLRINLERGRWILRDLPQDFVLVNVANFRVYLFREGRAVWQSRAQVGKPYRETPSFRSDITYAVFNPTWTVPPGILAKDVLPAARKNRKSLTHKGLRVIDRSGREVDPADIDWGSASARSFPYSLQQSPGPNNALGAVKLMFANPYSVYLHDTPKKNLFERTDRAFSSGCIRVQNPLELAALLLQDQPGWGAEEIRRLVDSGKTRTVFLKTPVPVLLLYWTAWVDYDGRPYFRKDVYGRDPLVLQALNGAFQPWKKPAPRRETSREEPP